MTLDDIYAGLTGIFHDVFMRDDIVLTPALTAADVEGWDSHKMIEIVIGVEETYGVRLETKELDNLNNVGDLARIVMQRALP